MTNNNNTNKTFDRSQATMSGWRRDGSKSPVIEVKQIGTPTNGTLGVLNKDTQSNNSFFKKALNEKQKVEPDEPIFILNGKHDPKPSPIIVNKNQHFKYKMRKNEEGAQRDSSLPQVDVMPKLNH